MKTLILRTFTHSKIWEGIEDKCHFELDQKDQILEWEPGYLNFDINDFDNVLGIYTKKYFLRHNGTENEMIISKLTLTPRTNTNIFPLLYNKKIYVRIGLEKKLWTGANKDLMFAIDDALVSTKLSELKSKEVQISTNYDALSFSLDSKTVNNILKNNGI